MSNNDDDDDNDELVALNTDPLLPNVFSDPTNAVGLLAKTNGCDVLGVAAISFEAVPGEAAAAKLKDAAPNPLVGAVVVVVVTVVVTLLIPKAGAEFVTPANVNWPLDVLKELLKVALALFRPDLEPVIVNKKVI